MSGSRLRLIEEKRLGCMCHPPCISCHRNAVSTISGRHHTLAIPDFISAIIRLGHLNEIQVFQNLHTTVVECNLQVREHSSVSSDHQEFHTPRRTYYSAAYSFR